MIPSLKEAHIIWHEGILNRLKNYRFTYHDEFVFHTQGVAQMASILAVHAGLDSEKAYVFGLLHDYGRCQDQKQTQKFHGQAGFEQMQEKGYHAVAKVCLTHSFASKTINPENYTWSKAWSFWAQQELDKIEYDDYDRLIQLCDKFCEKTKFVTLEERAEGIALRYQLSQVQKENLLNESVLLKKYFDEKCGCDVYQLLEIKPRAEF